MPTSTSSTVQTATTSSCPSLLITEDVTNHTMYAGLTDALSGNWTYFSSLVESSMVPSNNSIPLPTLTCIATTAVTSTTATQASIVILSNLLTMISTTVTVLQFWILFTFSRYNTVFKHNVVIWHTKVFKRYFSHNKWWFYVLYLLKAKQFIN